MNCIVYAMMVAFWPVLLELVPPVYCSCASGKYAMPVRLCAPPPVSEAPTASLRAWKMRMPSYGPLVGAESVMG